MDRRIEKKKWTLKRIAIFSFAGMVILSVVYGITSADYSSKLNIDKDKLAIATVKTGSFGEFITIDGFVLPVNTVYLDAVEGGVIENIIAEDGNMLKKGDTILTLSNSNLELDYINRETQILELLNQIENARISLKQNQTTQLNQLAEAEYQYQQSERKYHQNKLFDEKGMISKNEYKQSQDEFGYLKKKINLLRSSLKQDSLLSAAQIKQMDFSARRMKENLGIVKKNLEHLVVRAPLDGQLTSFDMQKGQLISKGENIAQMDVMNSYKIRVSIDEHYISRIFPGQQGTFDFDGKTYLLTIKKVNPQVKNGLFNADMIFEKDIPAGIKKGQNLNIKLQLSTQTTALLLEKGGFAQNTGGNWAFVLTDKNGSNEAVQRNIKIGRQNPQYYEVLEGLQEGDKVIISSYTGFENKEKLVIK